ncbi:acyltransferase [Clostridium perfringens]|uniref:acyltransferase n=1 Tax=Clostridium perfringens TaxID=1502 RepID=UPI0018E4BA92|nr:acyltransferase [Clostridium perfringens]MBI5995332.1 acyltransferase [Clostridium perfringens]
MKQLIRKLVYSKCITQLMVIFFSIFYDKSYIKGKFFEEKRAGFLWCLQSIPRLRKLHIQNIKFPVGRYTEILNGANIKFDPSSINVFQQSGCYFQAFELITIGKDVWIAKNVGIITANHDLTNPNEHQKGKSVFIGDNCWIGMNSVILPGVKLGDNTIVGAGSVVTKSFESGHVVIAGNPAKVIKNI